MNLKKLKKKVSRALDQLVDAVDPTDQHSHTSNPYAYPTSQSLNPWNWHSERQKALDEEHLRHLSALDADPMHPHEHHRREAELDQWYQKESMRLTHMVMHYTATNPESIIRQTVPEIKESLQCALPQTTRPTAANAQQIEHLAHFTALSANAELQQRDPQRVLALQMRGPWCEQQMASLGIDFPMFRMSQNIMGKKTGPSIEVLEQRQMELTGPKWYINDSGVEQAFKMEVENGPIATAMRGLEDGEMFSVLNKKRYDEIGRKALQNVCMGLSRVLDLSLGVDEMFRFRDEVNTRRKALPDEACIYKVTADAVVTSKCPIYVVSYRHTVFEQHWRMSDEQMKELFAILSVLTEERRVRLWCDRLLPPRYTAKWEGVGLVPYALFPVISLGCQSSFPGEEADDRLWLEVERHMGRVSHGVITIVGKVRSRASLARSTRLASSVQPKLIKVVGDGASVRRALLVFARSMIDGIYSTTTSSTYNLQESMKAVALDLLRGWDIERVMGKSDELDGSYDFSRCAESVFQGLKDSALQFSGHAFFGGVGARIETRASGTKQFWNGISEFVTDVRMAKGLKIRGMARSYLCAWEDGSEDMVVLATLHGPVELHGLMLVKKEGDDHRRGEVVSRLANINFGRALEQLSAAEVKECFRSPIMLVHMKYFLKGDGISFDCWDGTGMELPDFEKARQAEVSFDEVSWE